MPDAEADCQELLRPPALRTMRTSCSRSIQRTYTSAKHVCEDRQNLEPTLEPDHRSREGMKQKLRMAASNETTPVLRPPAQVTSKGNPRTPSHASDPSPSASVSSFLVRTGHEAAQVKCEKPAARSKTTFMVMEAGPSY